MRPKPHLFSSPAVDPALFNRLPARNRSRVLNSKSLAHVLISNPVDNTNRSLHVSNISDALVAAEARFNHRCACVPSGGGKCAATLLFHLSLMNSGRLLVVGRLPTLLTGADYLGSG
jgi:hypothetical protein